MKHQAHHSRELEVTTVPSLLENDYRCWRKVGLLRAAALTLASPVHVGQLTFHLSQPLIPIISPLSLCSETKESPASQLFLIQDFRKKNWNQIDLIFRTVSWAPIFTSFPVQWKNDQWHFRCTHFWFYLQMKWLWYLANLFSCLQSNIWRKKAYLVFNLTYLTNLLHQDCVGTVWSGLMDSGLKM